MGEQEVQDALMALIGWNEDLGNTALAEARVRTFEDAGLMTRNKGVQITLPDGSEFQLTILQSR